MVVIGCIEGYKKTRKHVCIAVGASALNKGANAKEKLILNHISSPHVLIASAVAASCAL